MPPFVGRKRLSSSPIPEPPPRKKTKTTRSTAPTPAPVKLAASPEKHPARFALESDSDSSLSDVDSDEFEDVPQASKTRHRQTQVEADEEDDGDEEVEWEDAPAQTAIPDFSNREFKDIKITVTKADELEDFTVRPSSKAGPSRRQKEARMLTHKMHVQLLLWHNAKRNAWMNDKKLHEILLRHLPPQIVREVDKWKRASGLARQAEGKAPPKDKKREIKKWKANGERNERDWGRPSQRLEEGKPDMSQGDPIIMLLKVLAAFWKKKFAITAPGLRKRGYGTKLALRRHVESFRNEKHDPAKHGEKIASLDELRKVAEKCEGSRDIGAQLFTALLRAIGMEARMVASLQPAGFGFTKAEEMVTRPIVDPDEPSPLSDDASEEECSQAKRKTAGKTSAKGQRPQPNGPKGGKSAPIDLDSEVEDEISADDASVVDVTPRMPKARPAKYDRDLAFPVYWCEAISPISSKVYPVSPLVLENAVATVPDLFSAFEPRGAKAEKTRQVMAYVVAYSPDFSAKDVTVRYLRKRLWPGKTKGFRVPVEKVPIYNKRGKVMRYDDYDWFKHSLSFYRRPDKNRTPVDDAEDTTDLVPAESEKKQVEGDTLQSLKASAEFVIEKHLRREEALIPDARPVRHFTSGKGEKQEDIPVYKRSDVRKVMTAESWHKEGRAPREGEAPMKLAPVRAVTLARKREAELHLIRTGEKQMQGLYSREQTDWIIPPPIKDGKIPKNAYGNIDCFVPSMVPKGAIHLPLKGTVRICKKLEIDFAEAVVGFEFGNKMAVPVIHGVVIAEENEATVRDAWRHWNAEQKRKEESKMEKLVLDTWRKMLIGLRIRSRVSQEYGAQFADAALPRGTTKDQPIALDGEEDTAGGFVPEHDNHELGGGFLMDHEDETHYESELVVDAPVASQEAQRQVDVPEDMDASQEYPTPVSAPTSSKKGTKYSTSKNDLASSTSELSDIEHQNQDEGMEHDQADSFLLDEDHGLPGPTSDSSTPLSKPSSKPPKQCSTTKRHRQARKSSSRITLASSKSVSTRRTPSRAAKSQVRTTNAGGTGYSESESESAGVPVAIASTTQRSTRSTGGRVRPNAAPPGAHTPTKPKTLPRKESTIVTSPYFE